MFKRNNPQFTLRKPSRLKRVMTFADVMRIRDIFDKLNAEYKAGDYTAERVLGLDELMIVIDAPERVLTQAPHGQRVRAQEPQYTGHVTLTGCIGADGSRYPPLYIFTGKVARPELSSGGGLCATGATGALSCC